MYSCLCIYNNHLCVTYISRLEHSVDTTCIRLSALQNTPPSISVLGQCEFTRVSIDMYISHALVLGRRVQAEKKMKDLLTTAVKSLFFTAWTRSEWSRF